MTAASIVVLSGGTGHTAEQVLSAALAQFNHPEVDVRRKVRIRRAAAAVEVVRQAKSDGAMICHSLVDPEVRQAVEREVRRLGVPSIDVLGPALALLGDHLKATPRGRAGLLYELRREQFDRMDAVDFTLAHDDGRRLGELARADVVIVGASRTSKSVTCFYLASHGIRAANVPLIPMQPPPQELTRLSSRRVIGLTMNAAQLASIRETRLERISHRPVAQYAELADVRAELRWVRELMAEHEWECIDVSYKATEEVAEMIIEMMPPLRRRGTKKDR